MSKKEILVHIDKMSTKLTSKVGNFFQLFTPPESLVLSRYACINVKPELGGGTPGICEAFDLYGPFAAGVT